MAVLVLTALAALVFAAVHRPREARSQHREIMLLVGTALLILLGDAATTKFSMRYLVPTMPLLVVAGILAALQLARGRVTVPAPPPSSSSPRRGSSPEPPRGRGGARASGG